MACSPKSGGRPSTAARYSYVGSSATTDVVIEESYKRILRLFTAQLERSRFLMGERPGSSDFGFFGQLTPLAGFDPTSTAVALELAPRVMA